MPNYHNGLIYKLCSKDTDITDFYIGSTTSFRHRKYLHKSDCNNEKGRSYNYDVYQFIRKNGGWENWDMVLIEYYKCDTKLELEKREREVIENLKPSLNQVIPTRTNKEWRDDNKKHLDEKKKDYYENNKKTILEKRKQYRQDNIDKIKEKAKENYENNKEKFKEYKKEYYQNNIKEKAKEKITCECGAIINKIHFKRHTKSIKHQGYMVLMKKNLNNI